MEDVKIKYRCNCGRKMEWLAKFFRYDHCGKCREKAHRNQSSVRKIHARNKSIRELRKWITN